ncbi:response regulator [Lysobacter sp. MMG2]|uniref:response regulator n=1 Tax=Lysobacter sp. MMG2 TaxID=2801338 RepID=UPI001C2231C1|nr:response regulator [Lysobacter sp. MMG2]MBU8978188.1 response regulator [Lysobacter sp. MMG2]
MALEALGHTAVHASSIAQAVHLLEGRKTFDAAMLDVNMGAETTADVAMVLTESGIPYVIASARAADDLPAGMVGTGHLRKPYLLDDLERALQTCRIHTVGPRD